jgi:hypothetical protein
MLICAGVWGRASARAFEPKGMSKGVHVAARARGNFEGKEEKAGERERVCMSFMHPSCI